MSAIATVASEPFFAEGRYSKRKRTQVNYCPSELDVSDGESDYEIPQAKKSRAQTASSRPLPKRKIFPFMQLPAEIRNMIYTYTLADPMGINLVATFKHKRRTVERVGPEAIEEITGPHFWTAARINDSLRRGHPEPIVLTPALLAVNKQIHHEARDVLYGNEFILADTFALYAFLLNLGPEGSKYLKTLRLLHWGYGRALKAYNHSCFALLAWATNVTSFYLDASCNAWTRTAKSCASQIYRDSFPFLEAIGRARGKPDAAVDVLKLRKDTFETKRWNGFDMEVVSGRGQYELFGAILSDILCKQQKRVMQGMTGTAKKAVKKRKVAVDSDEEWKSRRVAE